MGAAWLERMPANDDEPLAHSRGFPSWGPPTLCGDGEPPRFGCYVVTCPKCLDIIAEPGGLARRAQELRGPR